MTIIDNPPVGAGGHAEWHHAERTALNTINSRLLLVELANAGIYNVVTAPDNPLDDASESVQDAIDLAQPGSGGLGMVVLGPGSFRFAAGTNITRENVLVMGMGRDVTYIKPDAGITAFTISNDVTYANVKMADFTLLGGETGVHFVAPPEIPEYQTLGCSFERMHIRNQTDTGMLIERPLYGAYFNQVQFSNSVNGTVFNTGDAAADGNHINQFDLCGWNNCDVGLNANNLKFSLFNACSWESNDAAMLLTRCSYDTFMTSYFEHNGDPVADVHTPDVQVGQAGGGASCSSLYWYSTYCGPHNHQPGDIPHVWLEVMDVGEGLRMNFINHNLYGNSIDWGDGTTTYGEAPRDYRMSHVQIQPNGYLYMHDTATGSLRQLKVTNGSLVIT